MAGPSAAELKFLLSMNDQASGVLKNWIAGLDKAGKGAGDTENKNKSLGQSFDALVAKAKEASVAIAGVWASNKLAKSSLAAFSEYERGMYGVSQTTGQAFNQMGGFENRFNALSKTINNVPVEQLEHFAETAGRLGMRGKDIDTFITSAAQLQQVLHVTDDGVTAIGRMLFATGELEHKGVKSVTDFSNALAAVQPNTKASAEELVQFASSIGTNTAQFKIASSALLGIGAAAAQSNLPLQLTGTVIGKAFTQLKDAALSGSLGMQQITRATGVTQEKFQELLASKPEEAFLVLLDAINKLNTEGSATPLLQSLTLQGGEYTRVFTTLGANIDTIREKIKEGQQGAEGGGILDRMFGDFSKQTASKTAGLSRAFEGVVRDIGKALAPAYNLIVTPITAAFDAIDAAFRAFDQVTAGWGPAILAPLLVIGPGVAAAATAIRLLGPAALGVLRAFTGWNVLKTIFTSSLGLLPGLLAGVSTALGVLRTVLMAFVNPWGALAAAAVAAAVLIYENWEKLKTLLPDWLSNSIEYVGKALSDLWAYIKDTVKGWFTSEADKPAVGVKADEKSLDETKKKIEEKLGGGGLKYTLNADQMNALKSLSPQIEGRFNLNLQQNALDAAQKQLQAAGGKSFVEASTGLTVTDEDVKRAQKIYEYQKQIAANPIFEQAQGLADQIAEAQAIGAEAKNELAIRIAIRDAVNKTGEDEAKVTQEIGTRMRLLQQSQQRSALIDQARTIQDQTRSLGAVTAQEKSRADIIKQINDFEREHGRLLDADKQKLVDMLATYNQQAEAVRLLNSLDPRGQAEQRYQSELKTLEVLRQQGQLTEQMYRASVQRLNYQRSQNDPTTKHIQDLRDELRISSLYGDQQKIEQIALQERNTLQSQGVIITKQLNEQIERYAKAKVDADRANNSGLQGWAKAQGTLEDNLNKIQENFADGLADAVTGALSGQRGGFRQLFANLGKQMLSTGIRQMMAQSILGAGNPAGAAATNQANSALSQIEQLSKSGINSPQATVNATTAIINGQVQGAGTGGFAPTSGQINSSNSVPQFSPLAPASSLTPIGPTSSSQSTAPASLATAVPSQAVLTDAASKVASTALPNFASSPAFSAAAAAATQSVTTGTALKDITGETLKAMPPSQMLSPAGPALAGMQQSASAVDLAKTHLGQFEGTSNIDDFLKAGGVDIKSAQTAWCAGFVNSSLEQVGVKGNGQLTASSFLDFGQKIKPEDVQKGDIAVADVGKGFLKPGTPGNHVGFATGETRMGANGQQQFQMIAGNSKNAVNYEWRDADKLQFRRPTQDLNGNPLGQQIAQGKQALEAAPVQLDKTSLDALTKGQFNLPTSGPAPIRHNNPGALNYADWEKKYGAANGGTLLKDGTGQGNKIASFPTPEAGAAAQFDWWQNKSGKYGPTIGDSMHVYSGGNSTKPYQNFLENRGFGPDTNVKEMLANKDQAIAFGKAQSQWESGRKFPMDDQQWSNSYDLYRQKNGLGGGAGGVDTSQATEQMKQLNTTLQQTGTTAQTAVQPMKTFDQTTTTVGQATQQAQTGMQSLNQTTMTSGTAAMSASPSYMQLGMSAQQSGTQAQSAGSQFQQAGTQIQTAGSSAQMAGTSAGGAGGGFDGLGGSLGGLMGPLSQVQGGIGSFGSSIMGLVQQLMSGMGGMGGGGGFGGLFGGLGGLFGFAEGGQIKGPGTGTSDSILAQVSNGEFVVNAASAQKNLPLLHAINNDKPVGNLPKFASGGVVGGGKSSGLGLGERAMSRGSAQPSAQIAALSNQVATLSKVVSNGGSRGNRVSNISQNITVNANDAGSFRRSEGQLTSDAFLKMNRAARRNG
ncbi:hypothetical protein [Hyphomicrobium sp. ghe19]|uniref:hypothetical protein n=1 Tax=Hyphomicrobium sp. ghe19 TaxID=2682968 RepID=UPI0013668564|nr:hypothetical protein HYPP_02494 [Hyphomicrobium sp. ghe19]